MAGQSRLLAAYPLSWPDGWPRHRGARKSANFGKMASHESGQYQHRRDITMVDAMARVHAELAALGVNVVDDSVISTNLKLNLQGYPRSDQGEPADPGAAVYWQRKRKPSDDRDPPMQVMAIDIYQRARDNVAAIAATLEALRKIERHGGAQILDRAFSGFISLPKPSGPEWWEVLKLDRATATREQVLARHRELAKTRHPDAGGSDHQMAELNRARDQALQHIAA